MSAIGDYIHLHKLNYKKYGLGHKGKDGERVTESSVTQIFENRINELKQRNQLTENKNKLKSLSHMATQLLFADSSRLSSGLKSVRSSMFNYLQKEFENNLNQNSWKLNVDFDKGLSITKNLLSGDDGVKEGNLLTREQLINYRNAIDLKLSNGISKRVGLSIKQREELMQEAREMLNQLIDMCNANDSITADGSNLLKELKSKQGNYKTTLDVINELIGYPKANFIGQVGEYAASALQYLLAAKVGEVDQIVKKTLTENIVGKNVSSIQIISPLYADLEKVFSKEEINNAKKIQSGDVQAVVKATPNKVDVEFGYYAPIGANLSASVKASSVQGYGSIKLVDQTSLFSMLSNENTDLVNHYLNLVSTSKDEKGREYSNPFQSIRRNIVDYMHLIILYKALTGDIQGKEGVANVFVYINEGKRIVRFIDMPSIINTMANKMGSNRKIVKGAKLEGFENRKVPSQDNNKGIKDRITKLLAEVHRQKLIATISQKDIQDAFDYTEKI